MDIGIFISYKCSLPTGIGTGILEKVVIEYPSIVGKTGDLPSKLINYFLLCSIHWFLYYSFILQCLKL